ncbi:hypothetical protein [Polluticoccus soli]|uniref:hypothetical protein n=1 Tax=Polluticoccus soli TaxID=3034150 RepID=UPI0023E0A6FF|nr:hypothetical protein [Flavipsychrobacter sp. JY13-12]
MKTLLLALLLSALLFEQGNPDEEPETPIYYVGLFLIAACVAYVIKKLKASEAINSRRSAGPEELK